MLIDYQRPLRRLFINDVMVQFKNVNEVEA
jgi:hypothetical protein